MGVEWGYLRTTCVLKGSRGRWSFEKQLTNTALYPTIKDCLSIQNKQPICSLQLKKERKKWLIHVDVWQKPTQFCKAIILQLKNKVKNYEKFSLKTSVQLCCRTHASLSSTLYSSLCEALPSVWPRLSWLFPGLTNASIHASSHKHLLSARHPARPIWLDPPHPNGQSCQEWRMLGPLAPHQPWKKRSRG